MAPADTSTFQDMMAAMNAFYINHLETTIDGTFQVFHSFTYGEIVIAVLLLMLVVITAFKWVWEALR